MDPDKTLENATKLADLIISEPDAAFNAEVAYDLAQTFVDLHLWLATGGFLPDVWQRARTEAK